MKIAIQFVLTLKHTQNNPATKHKTKQNYQQLFEMDQLI